MFTVMAILSFGWSSYRLWATERNHLLETEGTKTATINDLRSELSSVRAALEASKSSAVDVPTRIVVDRYRQKPTPDEIRASIESQPHLNRVMFANSFVGELVQWTGTLTRIKNIDAKPGWAQIFIHSGHSWVLGEVLLDENRMLHRVAGEPSVNVRGRITKVEDNYIELDELKIEMEAV